jgi:hypothetical protein
MPFYHQTVILIPTVCLRIRVTTLAVAAWVFFVLAVAPITGQAWVTSFGGDTIYQPPRYLSGYGVSELADDGERLQAARGDALAALARQVRTQIVSSEDVRTVDDGRGVRSRYTNTIQTATDLQISGAEFEVVDRRGRTHVLAWIELDALREQFLREAEDSAARFLAGTELFDRALADGNLPGAEEALQRAEAALPSLYDAFTVIRALDLLAGRADVGSAVGIAPGVEVGGELVLPIELERRAMERRGSLRSFRPPSAGAAADLLARKLADQIEESRQRRPGGAHSAAVMPLLYQDADFSSPFGTRMAGLISSALAEYGERSFGNVVIRGSYWPGDREIEIQMAARDVQTGRVVAAAHTAIPTGTVDETTLRPANADIAVQGGLDVLNGQIVDGGIELEVWTDKGRNERALVFEEGDIIQFYFRVNQPAFLQLSYVLSSGDTVLLEERFYIGIDRVNRVVALPYQFQVVPPFGVERLIVTAHSGEPPPPDVIPREVSGQLYSVFRSPGSAVAATRGLAKVSGGTGDASDNSAPGTVRVGEAHLSITTMARIDLP